MLKKKIQDALNKQVTAEIYSAHIYLSMAAYFGSINLSGMATWMRVQYKEELDHAMKIFDYAIERGGRAAVKAIDAPQAEWQSPLAAFETAYKHERKVTAMIDGLVDLAVAESDHATNNFLQWFVSEQVEEEASADAVVQKLKLAGTSGGALFMIDRELGARVYTPPAAKAEAD
ncbi:ferritin [Candidatus Sumerlaeota bacterium]|nr:ferritin [Candidatus Sumerlaeota bacterium]